jgi:hypothetical protein
VWPHGTHVTTLGSEFCTQLASSVPRPLSIASLWLMPASSPLIVNLLRAQWLALSEATERED